MTQDHKDALAKGREQGRGVRAYLEALEQHKPKRGRKRTPESVAKQLVQVEQQLASADPLTRVQLLQKRIDLAAELEAKQTIVDLSALEEGFVKAAAEYGRRKRISYQAWREAGVEPAVLRRAGIARARG